MKTLQELWKEYRDKVYPEGTLPDQNRQLHQAFFAGAFTALLATAEVAALPEGQAEAELEKLHRECESVCRAHAEGRSSI